MRITTCPNCHHCEVATKFEQVAIPARKKEDPALDVRICPKCGTLFDKDRAPATLARKPRIKYR